MDTIECSQPASKSSWDSQDFCDISMVLKMAHFRKSTGPRWVKWMTNHNYHSYRITSNISRTFVGNNIVDNSDVVGASPVGAVPTTSSLST